jgi:hypothetical protein
MEISGLWRIGADHGQRAAARQAWRFTLFLKCISIEQEAKRRDDAL